MAGKAAEAGITSTASMAGRAPMARVTEVGEPTARLERSRVPAGAVHAGLVAGRGHRLLRGPSARPCGNEAWQGDCAKLRFYRKPIVLL